MAHQKLPVGTFKKIKKYHINYIQFIKPCVTTISHQPIVMRRSACLRESITTRKSENGLVNINKQPTNNLINCALSPGNWLERQEQMTQVTLAYAF